jgi:aryl-alcohol dehydrogenase-like predicted oxidoreductase
MPRTVGHLEGERATHGASGATRSCARWRAAASASASTIDLYQIHWPVPEEEIEEGWSTLGGLKERGVVRPEQVDPIVAAANLTLDKHDIATLLRRK